MTDKTTALRLALYYRAIATASFLVGAAIALAGIWLGLADAVEVVLTGFLQDDVGERALAAANLPLTVALVAVGTVVWQVGKATALHWTIGSAVEAGASADPGPTPVEGVPSGTGRRRDNGSVTGRVDEHE